MKRANERRQWIGAILVCICSLSAAGAQEGVRVTLGSPVSIPHPLLYYFPDSLFPFLPDATGQNNMMFWTNGISYRTFGPTLDKQGPADPPTRIATGGPSPDYA